MAGGKETPRQKMIGLMYLVLMALLAMNVSKEVINAFVTLSNNIEDQNADLVSSNGNMINMLFGKMNSPEISKNEKEELNQLYSKALLVHNMARNTANFYMQSAQEMLDEGQAGEWLYDAGDGFLAVKDLVHHEYDKKDDYDIPTRIFVGSDHANITDKGKELITRLENYRDSLCILLADKEGEKGKTYYFEPIEVIRKTEDDTTFINQLDEALVTVKESDQLLIKEIYRLLTMPEFVENHGEQYPWQAGQFDHAPMVAASAIFTSLKGRVLQAEKIVLNNFNEQNDAPVFPVNKVEPLAFASTSYLNVGDSLDMSVMVAAFDTTAAPEIRYWIDDTMRTEENMLVSNLNSVRLGGSVGEHVVVGDIAVQTKDGVEWRPFTYNYSVGSPNATVSASDLNVLYANGWENNIEVSAGGYDPSTVQVTGQNCTVTKSGDQYKVKATQVGGTAKISVTALDGDNNKVNLTTKEFRIQSLPKPQPYIAGKTFTDKTISKTVLCSIGALEAKDPSGLLNVDYKIEGFDLIVMKNGKAVPLHSNSNKLTQDMKDARCNYVAGQTLLITNVTASINGGSAFPIAPITLIVN
jgi:gliding motility-associated protein GldM